MVLTPGSAQQKKEYKLIDLMVHEQSIAEASGVQK